LPAGRLSMLNFQIFQLGALQKIESCIYLRAPKPSIFIFFADIKFLSFGKRREGVLFFCSLPSIFLINKRKGGVKNAPHFTKSTFYVKSNYLSFNQSTIQPFKNYSKIKFFNSKPSKKLNACIYLRAPNLEPSTLNLELIMSSSLPLPQTLLLYRPF
jgi:hypothetical protein